jgi:poly-gamma-glutamate capsule biosynthesis protein CapA/YwtB (metallophosphatase superfamily)
MRLFLCGDVMTGRGIDQILPVPGDPRLHERYVKSAIDYVQLAERVSGQSSGRFRSTTSGATCSASSTGARRICAS